MANEDQAKGKAQKTGGKIQEKAGEITGDKDTQAEGQKKPGRGRCDGDEGRREGDLQRRGRLDEEELIDPHLRPAPVRDRRRTGAGRRVRQAPTTIPPFGCSVWPV